MPKAIPAVSPGVRATWSKALMASTLRDPIGKPMFTDTQDGFDFKQHTWKEMARAGEILDRYHDDAVAHRVEAIRRKAVCRLSGLEKEAAHWHAFAVFITKLALLDPLGEEDGGLPAAPEG